MFDDILGYRNNLHWFFVPTGGCMNMGEGMSSVSAEVKVLFPPDLLGLLEPTEKNQRFHMWFTNKEMAHFSKENPCPPTSWLAYDHFSGSS